MKVRVFWEDQSGGPIENFPPHRLLLRSLHDRGDVKAKYSELHQLHQQISPVPCKGNGNLLNQLKIKACTFADQGCALIATLDGDKLPELMNSKNMHAPCNSGVKSYLAEIGGVQAKPFAFVRVAPNLESLIVYAESAGLALPAEVFSRAKRKILSARDQVINELSKDPHRRSINLPWYTYLVRKTADLLLQ